jgi:hypothetical protein
MTRRVDFDKGLPWLAWIVPIMALMSLIGVYQSLVRLNYVKEHFTSKTIGVITDFSYSEYQARKYKTMVIDYIVKGDTLQYEQGIDFSEDYEYGDKVELIYNPEDPSEAEVNSENAIYGGLKASSLLTLIFTGASAVFIYLYRRKLKKEGIKFF